jgi:hypothetical protein
VTPITKSTPPVVALDPQDAKSIARWAAERAVDASTPQRLWQRSTIDGVGFMLTGLTEAPRAGLWKGVIDLDLEDAHRIARRGPRGWPALVRVADQIATVLGLTLISAVDPGDPSPA